MADLTGAPPSSPGEHEASGAVADRLAADGARVAILEVDLPAGQEVRALELAADVPDPAVVASAIDAAELPPAAWTILVRTRCSARRRRWTATTMPNSGPAWSA